MDIKECLEKGILKKDKPDFFLCLDSCALPLFSTQLKPLLAYDRKLEFLNIQFFL